MRAARLLCLPPLLALAACQTLYPTPKVEFSTATAPALPEGGPPAIAAPVPVALQPVAAPPVTGSIYQSAMYRPLFEDHRARMVGDTLTVVIVEKVSATQKATSTVDKSGKIDSTLSALPGVNASKLLSRAAATGTGSNSFEGKGTTESRNDFSGTITALVTGVLPNGHLMIAGEKQVGVNQHVDILRFTGQVDPRAILPGNSIQSANIANVRIENRGVGAQADAQGIGWLGRFFLNLLPI